jgi:hypothetical protein
MKNNIKSPEWIAGYLVSYLYKKYHGTLHVRRVASWIGFIILAVDRASDSGIRLRHARQIEFDYKKRKFRVGYNHAAGSRGGIDIKEVLHTQGGKLGEHVLEITTLLEAEKAYLSLESHLKKFCRSN